jgi:hypothetical protein
MVAANYNGFRSVATEDVLQRSQAFGRTIATAIYNWSLTEVFHGDIFNVLTLFLIHTFKSS